MRLSTTLFRLSAALVALFSLRSSNAAEPATININCLKSRISSLTLQEGMEDYAPSSPNYCNFMDADLPPQVRAVLLQIVSLNQKASDLFQLPIEKLFPTPFEVAVKKNPRGLLASVVQSSSVGDGSWSTVLTIGVFSDWDGTPLNAGVYEHELGHVIAENSDNLALPTIYKQLASTSLVTETIADLSALHATGSIVSPEAGLPACLQQFRQVTFYQSYDSPADTFTMLASRTHDLACCESLTASGAHTAHSRAFCSDYEKKNAEPPFASFGDTRFSGSFYAANKDYAEPHELGLPLNSFLAAVQHETGLGMGARLLSAMRETDSDAERVYLCEVPNLRAFLAPRREHRYSFSQVFAHLQQDLPDSARESYHRLWLTHRMDVGMQIADTDSKSMVEAIALQHGADDYNNLSLNSAPGFSMDPRLRTSGCWKPSHSQDNSPNSSGSLDADRPGCSFSCKRVI